MNAGINEHNLLAAAMWSSGGRAHDEISRSVAEAEPSNIALPGSTRCVVNVSWTWPRARRAICACNCCRVLRSRLP